ncbi:MAG: putative competence-damage inducible protein [Candidatus Neomarinimicrobiota bacterium]|nr:MAG: putative competence-damage inducible protein [Candidatus Neomarinimicrobiota bacterium]
MPSNTKPFILLSMKVSILSIGNELLSGKTMNTNANWLGNRLTKIGCRVDKQVVVPDEEKPIINALNFLVNDKEGCIIVTGGLGPTDDDITREVLFKYVKTESKFDLDYWNKLSKKFKNLGIDIPESNRSQALVPQNGDVIDNSIGSARGFKFKINGMVIFSLPGVPIEMEAMTNATIIPWLKERVSMALFSQTIRTTGIPESKLIELISSPIRSEHDCEIGYYPSLFGVDIRISSNKIKYMESLQDQLTKILGNAVFALGDDSIEEIVVNKALENDISLSIAESCTGGLIGHRITQISGSSKIFKGSVVVYSNSSKVNLLGVGENCITKYGAVSEETAKEMAEKVRKMFSTKLGLSITGIAGPDGGSKEKPIGLTYIGVSTKNETKVRKFQFGSIRKSNKARASQAALNWMRLEITNG